MVPVRLFLAVVLITGLFYLSFSRLQGLRDFDQVFYGQNDEAVVNGGTAVDAEIEDGNGTFTAETSSEAALKPIIEPEPVPSARISLVSMLYGEQNEYYERSLASHVRYATRHGYDMDILRRDLVHGIWSKLAHLLHILIDELEKPAEDRTEWLMWVDADSIVINPFISLDIFLPPERFSDVHVIASKDQNGFNAGMFFIRVHQTSITLVNKALAYPQYKPDENLDFLEQTALYLIFQEPDFRPHVVYEPHAWFNAYEFDQGYEGQPGTVFVHFAGLGNRWEHMEKWLDIVEGAQRAEWEIPLHNTSYPNDVERFWSVLESGQSALQIADTLYEQHGLHQPEEVRKAIEHLQEVIWNDADQINHLVTAIETLKSEMHLPRT